MSDTYDDVESAFDVSAIPTDDDAVVRRVKAVAATRPLHDLERNKSSWDGDFWDRYDLMSLAVAAIDQVALAMGVSAGMLYETALEYVASQAARQHPDDGDSIWVAVAGRVLDGLISDSPHEAVYAAHDGDIVHRRVHPFRLLYEQWSADESVHLRASEQAINVLVDALDLDVTSAQIAAEVQMRVLIERNALAGAVSVARRARYQSIQYLERVRTVVRDTSIDPDAYDWEKEVPEFLTGALDHVLDRIRCEGELVQAVEERRDDTVAADYRQQANLLIAMLRECSSRHVDLQRHLMGARAHLRAAQDDRLSRPQGSLRRADLETDLLVPLLQSPTAAAAPLGQYLFGAFAAPRQPLQPTLAVTVDELLTPPSPHEVGEDEPEPEFGDEPASWWEPYWAAAEDILDGVTDAASLSALVAQARAVADATSENDEDGLLEPDVLVAALCHLAHGLLAAPIADGGPVVLLAVPTGTRLCDPAVNAEELLVVRADVYDPAAPIAVQPLDLSVAG
ncbi:MAG: hypothetical protein ABIV94_01845 [Acidimicrobiales bacterium]